MLVKLLPWASTVLVMGLMIVGMTRGLMRKYPCFYSYLGCVLAADLLRFWSRTFAKDLYLPVYWYSQFICVAVGYGIMWEVYGHIFKSYPGTARMARFLVTFALAIVVLNTLIQSLAIDSEGLRSVIDLERNLRVVQAILLTLSIGLVLYYEIPLGRNVAGLLFGYGCFVVAGVLLLTLREKAGRTFHPFWNYGQLISYLVTLAIWVYTLRSYDPVPLPAKGFSVEEDYNLIANQTEQSLARIKNSIARAAQP